MRNVSRIIDFILSRVVIFALAFIWIRYYSDKLWTAAVLSLAVTAALSMLLTLFFKQRRRKKDLSAYEQKRAEAIVSQFIYSQNGKNLSFFSNFLKEHYRCMSTGECVLAETGSEATLIFTAFKHAPLTPDDLARIYISAGKYSADKLLVFTNSAAPATVEAARRPTKPRVVLQDAAETYEFLKTYEAYPEITVKLDPPKKRGKLKLLLAVALSRRNIRGYMLGALFMVAGSLFVPYTLYYLISASVFLTLALLSCVDFKFKAELEEKIFS